MNRRNLTRTGKSKMNRRSIINISTMTVLGLALVPSSAVSQQKSLKDQLVGTWTLVSCDIKQPFCVNPSGTLMLAPNGRYAQVIAAQGRPKPATAANRADVKPEEYKAMAQGLVANFGTWSVNEADKAMMTHVEGALFPNAEGADGKVTVNLTGDQMTTVGQNPAAGGFV
jgi:Lipocalin-like domain